MSSTDTDAGSIRPAMQTKRGGIDAPPNERGDCLPACLATVLHVDIEDVAVPHSDDEHWWDATQRALEPHGYHLAVADAKCWPWGLWLAAVPSKNLIREAGTAENHLIVMSGCEVIHDPSLGEVYLRGTTIEDLDVREAYVLVPFDQRTRKAA